MRLITGRALREWYFCTAFIRGEYSCVFGVKSSLALTKIILWLLRKVVNWSTATLHHDFSPSEKQDRLLNMAMKEAQVDPDANLRHPTQVLR